MVKGHKLYASIAYNGSAARFAFAVPIFGEFSEALFWLQLPHTLSHFVDKSANRTQETSQSAQISEAESATILNRIASKERCVPGNKKKNAMEPWLIFLILFHVYIVADSFISRENVNFQLCLSVLAFFGVYLAERINSFLGESWKSFASQNYF